MQIFIKGEYTISGEIRYDEEVSTYQFEVPVGEGRKNVSIEISPREKKILAVQKIEVAEDIWDILQSDISDGSELQDQEQRKIGLLTKDLSTSTRKVMSLIKYGLNQTRLNENLYSSGGDYWSVNQEEWKLIPWLISISLAKVYIPPLNEKTKEILQNHLDKSGPESFFALRHLHRARNETVSRYKWIEATIAAELAIKEVLTKINPELSTLLVELPSPPLTKLYGTILESYTGTRTSLPNRVLGDGSSKRNKLIHSPGNVEIDSQDAINYVSAIEKGINELIGIVSKTNPLYKIYSNELP